LSQDKFYAIIDISTFQILFLKRCFIHTAKEKEISLSALKKKQTVMAVNVFSIIDSEESNMLPAFEESAVWLERLNKNHVRLIQ
jgi:hypothetical protein